MEAIAPPNSESCAKNFKVNEAFDVWAKEILHCKSMQLFKKPILLQLLVEPDQSSMVY